MKSIKILLILLLGILTVGLTILMAIIIRTDGFGWGRMKNPDAKPYLTKEIGAEQIRKLYVKLDDIYDVKILSTEEDKIKVEAYYSHTIKENERVNVTAEGDQLNVTASTRPRFGIIFDNYHGEVRIYLPESVRSSMTRAELETVAGDIFWEREAMPQNPKAAVIKTTSGDVRIDALHAEKISIQTTSGDVYPGELQADNISIRTTSGDVTVQEIKGEYVVESTSGDLELKALYGKGKVNTTSGEILAAIKELTGETAMESLSGDVELTIAKEIKAFIDTQSSAGDIRVESDSVRAGEKLRIQTTSGDIKVIAE